MSITSRSPTRVAGATVNSGNVNTGEQNFTLGGAQNICVYSGDAAAFRGVSPNTVVQTGPDVLFFSGAGRLKDIVVVGGQASGVYPQVTFYDAGAVLSGGGTFASGSRILGIIPASSGFAVPTIFAYDTPFNSGLCANIKSGTPTFNFTFTPETNLPNPG